MRIQLGAMTPISMPTNLSRLDLPADFRRSSVKNSLGLRHRSAFRSQKGIDRHRKPPISQRSSSVQLCSFCAPILEQSLIPFGAPENKVLDLCPNHR